MANGLAAGLASDCDALLFGAPAATGPVVSCRVFSSGAGKRKGLSIRRDSWDDALVLLPIAFSVLAALAACLASSLASCFITPLSRVFAYFAVSSKRLSRAFTAAGVTGVPLANNDNSPSKSGGSAFCVVLTSSNNTFRMPLGGRPVQSQKRMVHRTEYTRRAETVFKICGAERQDAGNTNGLGCAGSAGTFIDGTRSSYHQRNIEVHHG